MFKRLFLLIIAIAGILTGLQLWGGRDFSQVGLAWDKYRSGGSFSSFVADVGVMFAGGKVKEGKFPLARYENQMLYRWKDAAGETHITETKPESGNYEEIRMGDLNIQIQESLSKEEIDQTLNKPEKDN